jgi:hypothetical protein
MKKTYLRFGFGFVCARRRVRAVNAMVPFQQVRPGRHAVGARPLPLRAGRRAEVGEHGSKRYPLGGLRRRRGGVHMGGSACG